LEQANRRQKNLVRFGDIERKLAKLTIPTFTYRSSSSLFYTHPPPLPPIKNYKLHRERERSAEM